MKTQLQKPARGKASYGEEYKQQALELWRRSGRSAAKVAGDLGFRRGVDTGRGCRRPWNRNDDGSQRWSALAELSLLEGVGERNRLMVKRRVFEVCPTLRGPVLR
jgi:hypothetical protein